MALVAADPVVFELARAFGTSTRNVRTAIAAARGVKRAAPPIFRAAKRARTAVTKRAPKFAATQMRKKRNYSGRPLVYSGATRVPSLSAMLYPSEHSAVIHGAPGGRVTSSGIPDWRRVRQTYFERTTMGNGVTSPYDTSYVLNGMYDPTVAVGGHQPTGFDDMISLYTSYIVLAAKVTMKFISAGSGKKLVGCALSPDDWASTIRNGNQQDLMESRGDTRKVRLIADVAGEDTATITFRVNMKNFITEGAPRQGTGSVNPSNVVYAHAFAMVEDGTTVLGTSNVILRTSIEFDVVYYQPKTIASS